MISAGKKYFLNDLDFALGHILPESAGRIAALADYDEALGTEAVTFLVERPRFWESGDVPEVSRKLREAANLETVRIHLVPPFFITKTSSGKINRKKTLQDWKACRESRKNGATGELEPVDRSASFQAQVDTSFPSLPQDAPIESLLDSLGSVVMRLICEDHGLEFDAKASISDLRGRLAGRARKDETKVFSIVALVDGIKLGFGTGNGFITEEFIARVATEVGSPVSVEHICVPPAQILFSDVVFHDYFMPRDAGVQYRAFSSVIQRIKNAGLILIDDEDAFRLRDFCVYPRLSHRFNNDPEADLLAHRLALYTRNHHQLAREVVAGKDLALNEVTPAIRHLSSHLQTPIMKLAFHKQFEKFTKEWDYQQYRNYVSDVDYQQNPVKSAEIQAAILRFIGAHQAQARTTTGVATAQLTLKDPPHFCSFLTNRQAVDFVVSQYDSFCIGGLPSSLPYLEQRIQKQGKPYFYASTMNPDRTDFDCQVMTGFSGVAKTDKPYFDFVHLGDQGGRPHNVPPEVEKLCPSLAAGDAELMAAFRKANNDLVAIGNYVLNHEASFRLRFARANPPLDGTVVVYGPVYARSGFGLLARGWALALHHAGVRVRVAPVDCPDPKVGGDLDDCDLYLLRKLENTEIHGPLTAIFAYVPIYAWPKMALPEPSVRIMLTTFDSSAQAKSPPYRLVHICNQMDQVWLANRSEEQAWIRGGLKPELIRTFRWPNDWIDNPILGPVRPKPVETGGVFRFLHVSVFFPRRRLDVLIQAFFEEFADADSAELYLKITYPAWHPVVEKPKHDLNELIERFRRQTGSKARVIVDETMGTRQELARLFDSCDFYVSPDTSSTAPVSEALFRGRLGIITDGWNVELPPEMIVVKNSARQVQVTPEMADYMPHHRGGSFPALEVADLRAALRQARATSPAERAEKAARALQFMREHFSYAATVPACLTAMREAWQRRNSEPVISIAPAGKPVKSSPSGADLKLKTINWCGLQLFYGKIAALNRGLCLELLRGGHRLTLRPSNGPFQIEEMALDARPEYLRLAERFYAPIEHKADITVSARWHPIFEEEAAAKQVMISTWWSGAIPAEWVRRIRDYVDEVWVPSRHVRDNFLERWRARRKTMGYAGGR